MSDNEFRAVRAFFVCMALVAVAICVCATVTRVNGCDQEHVQQVEAPDAD